MERRLKLLEKLKSTKLNKLTVKQGGVDVKLTLKKDLADPAVSIDEKVLDMLEKYVGNQQTSIEDNNQQPTLGTNDDKKSSSSPQVVTADSLKENINKESPVVLKSASRAVAIEKPLLTSPAPPGPATVVVPPAKNSQQPNNNRASIVLASSPSKKVRFDMNKDSGASSTRGFDQHRTNENEHEFNQVSVSKRLFFWL